MTEKDKQESDDNPEFALIDDLIAKIYDAIKENIKETAKLGDFIKMVELKHKLLPPNASQKRFWNMLEKVRREALKTNGAPSATGKKKSQSTKSKTTRSI